MWKGMQNTDNSAITSRGQAPAINQKRYKK